jgi:transposase
MRLLAKHIRKHCNEYGHPCLDKLSRGTVSKILAKNMVKPHKIKYYLERRDPDFDEKMVQVLHIYKEVQLVSETKGKSLTARDYEYKRHGTLSFLAGIDLLTGEIIATVENRHRSAEFINFLKELDAHYVDKEKIKIVLDNHSSHISKETRVYLATVPNRFEFVFTPKHGSWLNLIESFFGKMAHTVLRGIRVKSKQELKERLLKYINEINESPTIYRWKYKLDSISVA